MSDTVEKDFKDWTPNFANAGDIKIHDVEQRSPEWYEIRRLKFTGSHAQAISANGKGLDTLIKDLILDQMYFAKEMIVEDFDSPDMQRGRELEPAARIAYEFTTGHDVEEVGFVERHEFVGCSPDGLVNDDGIIEIKCKNDKKHLAILMGEPIESKEVWQCKFNAMITGRSYCDYVSYNPNFKQSIVIARFIPTEADRQKMNAGLQNGIKKLREFLNADLIKKELSC